MHGDAKILWFQSMCLSLKCIHSNHFKNQITRTNFNLKKYNLPLELIINNNNSQLIMRLIHKLIKGAGWNYPWHWLIEWLTVHSIYTKSTPVGAYSATIMQPVKRKTPSLTYTIHIVARYPIYHLGGVKRGARSINPYKSNLRKFGQLPTFRHQQDSNQQPQDYSASFFLRLPRFKARKIFCLLCLNYNKAPIDHFCH